MLSALQVSSCAVVSQTEEDIVNSQRQRCSVVLLIVTVLRFSLSPLSRGEQSVEKTILVRRYAERC